TTISSILLLFFYSLSVNPRYLHSFPTRRSSDLAAKPSCSPTWTASPNQFDGAATRSVPPPPSQPNASPLLSPLTKERRWECSNRSEEHTSELQSRGHLVCRLLLEKKNMKFIITL